MISRLVGSVLLLKPPVVVLDVSGVGYEIEVPIPDCALLKVGANDVVLYTHLVIREDVHLLYGFLTINSRDSFRQLIKVSGIGPRIALSILSTLTLDELYLSLQYSDSLTLCKTPGIGKKVAERMILELKGKLTIESDSILATTEIDPKSVKACQSIRNDISNALLSLGYSNREIVVVMRELPSEITDLSSGIKEALKLISMANN